MYSINQNGTNESIDLLYLRFLAIRLRIQQLVVLFVHTWKNDKQATAGDLILKLIRDAGTHYKGFVPSQEEFKNPKTVSKEDTVLSELDLLILSEINKEKGSIQLGSDSVMFNFYFELQGKNIAYVNEELTAPVDVKCRNQRFFDACASAFKEAPPKHPTENQDKHLFV